mmetsp:Transcript_54351/g.100363  ORF Transcript_54351/g.100363 Transcript_54351/m.100363 type:complete len:544 (-) Transcript_54351:159-1790(-)
MTNGQLSKVGTPSSGLRPGTSIGAYCEALEWSCPVDDAPASRVCARLTAKERLLPRCQVEVWTEAASKIENGVRPELAYCKAAVSFQTPTARIEWLGRSRGRHVEGSARGIRCLSVPSAAAFAGQLTIAQAILGLAAAICGLFGATLVELLAEDSGSGRLVAYYVKMGFEVEERERGNSHTACWMRGGLDGVAKLGPVAWFNDLVPAGFEGSKWLSSFCTLTNSPLASLGRFLTTCRQSSPETAKSLSTETSRCYTADSRLSTASSMRRPKSALVPKHITRDVTQDSLASSPRSTVLVSREAPAVMDLTSRPPSRSHIGMMSAPCPVAAPMSTMIRPDTVMGPLSRAAQAKSDADRDKLATWRWRVQWPDGAVFVAQLSKADKKSVMSTNTRAGKRLRIETRVLAPDRSELACCLVAVPPERRFARVLWMGRGQACESTPAHPHVRGCRSFSTCDGGCVTTATALLGAAAMIASQLGISSMELFPSDNGSGKLAPYLEACGFRVAAPRDQDIMLRLETTSVVVARQCCPAAWTDRLTLQASSA